MAVYVDELRMWRPDRGHTCHLTADSTRELNVFAREHGIPDQLRHRGARVPHYDLGPRWRAWAVSRGAVFVPAKEQALRRIQRACSACGEAWSAAELDLDRRCWACAARLR